ncbi:MAG: carboxypeptidase regulatory-like domain-containing protein [Rikenella sp.]|nr:carboxypeptidase regulatory-like domain-containing protein [Rikenella sp.]
MKKIAIAIGVLAALFCSCSQDITETSSVGSIAGSVSDRTTGEPVATVNVSISPDGSQTVTGSDGSFSFVNLKPGDYTLSIRKEGYTPNTVNATVKAEIPTSVHMTIDRIPASITADKTLLDFGESLTTLSFTIVNSGYTDLAYRVETGGCEWLSTDPEVDILGYGKTATIVATIDRSRLPAGDNEANIVVRSTSGDGNVEVKVVAVNNAGASVNTLNVTNVANTTATLNGEIINPGQPSYTERGFVYDTQSTPTISACINKLSAPVTSDKKFSSNIDGLLPTQTYFVRSYIIQNGSTIYGNIVSFTTSQQPTTLSTSAVTQIGASTATFNASVLDIGAPAYSEKGFCYSKGSTPTIADNRKSVSGFGAGDFSLPVTNLDYPVTYYVRAYVIQVGETVYGNIVSFKTNTSPVVVNTYAATEITSSSAVLNGSISQVGSPAYTEKGFCISTGYYSPTIEDTKVIVAGTGEGNFSSKISNLEYNTRYQFRAYAIQDGAVVYGNTLDFSTAYTQASVSTSDVSNIGYTSATFNGIIAAIGDPVITERGFCYTTRNYPSPTISDKAVKVSGIAAGAFKIDIQNLEEDTRYYVRAYVIQDGNPIYGEVKSFDTGYAPIVATVAASSVKQVSSTFWQATFRGVFIDGNPTITDWGFIYGTTANPTVNTGTVIPKPTTVKQTKYNQDYGSYITYYAIEKTITTLIPYRTYYYRAYVKTSLGYIYGETEVFTTY